MNRYILLLLLVTFALPIQSFETLDDLETYAKRAEEFPKPDNSNWLDLDYSSYHAKESPNTLISHLMQMLGLKKKAPNVAEQFHDLLLKLTNGQASKEATNTVLLLDPLPDTAIVVWTDLLGSFHSLVRALRQLYKQKYIDNNLILQPKCYFIFNGNTLGSSPALLEMFLVITKLMYKNPKQVFYLKGSQEKDKIWLDTPLKSEITQRVGGLKIPLAELITNFFASLPQAMYIKLPDAQSFVRIASSGLEQPFLNEKTSHVLIESKNVVKHISIDQKKASESSILVKALLRSELNPITYRIINGLILIGPENGAITWSSFSAATQAAQKLYKSHIDAFVILKTAADAKDWSITLYTQDLLKKLGFEAKKYRLLTGQASNQKSYTNKLAIGCTLDLTNEVATISKRLELGMNLAANKENEVGPYPSFLQLIFLNDSYSPQIANLNVQEFLTVYKTPLILSPTGATTTEALLPLIKEKKILVIFPWTGSAALRKPELTHIFHLRASYAVETKKLLMFALDTLKLKSFAFFYQDDSLGLDCFEEAKKILEKTENTTWIGVSHVRNNLDVKKAAKTITDFSPEAIVFFSLYAPSTALINAIELDVLAEKTLMGVSTVSDTFKLFLKSKGLQFIISHTSPDPFKSELPLVKEYREAMKSVHYEQSLTTYSLEGFIDMQVLVELLSRIKGPVTMDAIIEQAEAIKNFNFKGLMLNFNSDTRELRDDVWIDAT